LILCFHLSRVIDVHILPEVLAELDSLVYACMSQFAPKLKDEERLHNLIFLQACGFIDDCKDF